MRTDLELVELMNETCETWGILHGLCRIIWGMNKDGRIDEAETQRLRNILSYYQPMETKSRAYGLVDFWWPTGDDKPRYLFMKDLILKLEK